MARYLLPIGLVLVFAAGCAQYDLGGPGPAASHAILLFENPSRVAVTDTEFFWNQLVDTIDDYFQIVREDRVRIIGNVLTEGQIETAPVTGATFLEPWHADSVGFYQRLESTLQTIRRRAVVRVMPGQGGHFVEVVVIKELEDLSQPERSTVGRSMPQPDAGTVPDDQPTSLGWIPLGRDTVLEQRILADLHARVEGAASPGP